jgi:hypothetical protein
MGVVVRETIMETRMAVESTIANSRKSYHVPAIMRMGIDTSARC